MRTNNFRVAARQFDSRPIIYWFCFLASLSVFSIFTGCGAKPQQSASEARLESHERPVETSSPTQQAPVNLAQQADAAKLDASLDADLVPEIESFAEPVFESTPGGSSGPRRGVLADDPLAVEKLQARPLLAKSALELSLGNKVEVYFATDRLPTAELLPNPLRIFAPSIVVGLLCSALFIGFSAARRLQSLWLLGCGLAVCLGIMVLHSSIIRYQQYWRLASNASTRFSTLRDERTKDYPLHVGIATVSLPKRHMPGRLESPSVLRLEFSEDPSKHIVLQRLQVESKVDNWFEQLQHEVEESSDEQGFIFIHGYNVRFEDALKRTAQLYTDLGISGPAICYSWPSRGQVIAYTADEATVAWSSTHFERLLLDLRQRANCSRINIIAHSMGNRALLEAVERLYLRSAIPSDEKLINSLVLAAPDVDVDQFHSRFIVPVQSLAKQTTVYFSDTDRALQLSAGLHRAPRLGFTHSKIPNAVGFEAIHIGPQSLFALGHSYYGSDVAVIDDMRLLLGEGKLAAERPFLATVAQAEEEANYWQIDRALHAQRTNQSQLR